MIIGLTGGSGTGKTSVSLIFEKAGFETVDFDKVTRELYKKGSPCLDEITKEFGEKILFSDGTLNRRALGEIVFADKSELCRLEKTVFKYILDYAEKFLKTKTGKNILLDAPTLFESGLSKKCDYTIAVVSDKEIQIKRILQRDSISEENALNRINSQKTSEFFYENCDFVIENNKGFDELRRQTEKLIGQILK